MKKYTDEEIRNCSKVTLQIAGSYLGIPTNAVGLGMINGPLPIGIATKKEDRYSDSWSYYIVPERLIAYNYGTINELQVQNIEKNLDRIITEFTAMKNDLLFILSEDAKPKT